MSSLPNTIPNVAASTPPDRVPNRTDDSTRARNDDDRFSERLDRETKRADRSRETERSEPSRNDEARSDRPRAESKRTDQSEAVSGETSSAAEKTDQTTNDQPQEAGVSDPQAADPSQSAVDDAELEATLRALAENATPADTELTVTANSGQDIPLKPPVPPANSSAEPGSLSRWFADASGAGAQMTGLLSKLGAVTSQANGEAPDLASLIGQGTQNSQKMAGQTTEAGISSSGQTASFADAMASANASTETMDAMTSQAMIAKAVAALETGTTAAAPLAQGPTVATGAQPNMTAVPQTTAGQAVPVTALAVEINRQAMNGKTQFEIRLDPPELGRLNVKLEVGADGQTRTHMVVERGETLDMLTTDSRSLERALQQAGLKAEPGSVTFELARDFNDGLAQNGNQPENGENGGNDAASPDGTQNGDDNLIPELTDMSSVEAVRQQLYLTGHLDVRV